MDIIVEMDLFEPIGEALIVTEIYDLKSDISFEFYIPLILIFIFSRILLLSICYK